MSKYSESLKGSLCEKQPGVTRSAPAPYRYYLKNNMDTETLCSDDDAQDLLRESQISLLQLSTVEVAAQLSMRDFELFRNIASTE